MRAILQNVKQSSAGVKFRGSTEETSLSTLTAVKFFFSWSIANAKQVNTSQAILCNLSVEF